MLCVVSNTVVLQCFDAVGLLTGRTSGLWKLLGSKLLLWELANPCFSRKWLLNAVCVCVCVCACCFLFNCLSFRQWTKSVFHKYNFNKFTYIFKIVFGTNDPPTLFAWKITKFTPNTSISLCNADVIVMSSKIPFLEENRRLIKALPDKKTMKCRTIVERIS